MVYLFHFELPVEEATWTCLATAYWSYLKNLTVSEVDACSASVMHLSRAYDAMGSRLQPSGGGDEGGGAGSETVYNGADDGHSEISFLTFFYVNTKKGIIECGSFASVVGSFDCLFICLCDAHMRLSTWKTFVRQFQFCVVGLSIRLSNIIKLKDICLTNVEIFSFFFFKRFDDF